MEEPLDKEARNRLVACMVLLVEQLNVVNIVFWAKLQEKGVITQFQREEIQSGGKTHGQQRQELVDLIQTSSQQRYTRFLEALIETEQIPLAKAIDENFYDAWQKNQKQDAYHIVPELRTEFSSKQPSHDFSDEDVATLKDYYQTKLQRSFIHELAERSDWFHLSEVFTQMVLKGKDVSGTSKSSCRFTDSPYYVDNFFEYDGVLSTLIEGDPGSGKTTLLKRFAWIWSSNLASEHLQDGGASSRQDSTPSIGLSCIKRFKLLIFVDCSHEGVGLNKTLCNALKGTDAQKHKAMQFAKIHPELTLYMFDALDEFRCPNLRREIFDLVESRGYHVLVSVRKDHPVMAEKGHLFDRLVKTSGFNITDTPVFVETFMKAIGQGEEKSKRLRELIENNMLELGYFLATPLNCTLTCLLYSEGEIKEEDFEGITLDDLLIKQERFLLNREARKRSRRDLKDWKEEQFKDLQKIYRMAFVSLLRDHGKYSLDQVKAFGIKSDSPALVILRKMHTTSIQRGDTYLLGWWHEAHREFDAAQWLLENPDVRYLAAGKPELNQVTFFLISMMAKWDLAQATEVLHTAMFLQGPKPFCRYKINKLLRSHAKCKEVNEARHVVRDHSKDDISTMFEEDKEVQPFSFKNCSDVIKCMQKSGWLIENTVALSVIGQCLSVCVRIETRTKLASTALFPFLPTERKGSNNKYHRYIAVPNTAEWMCINWKDSFLGIWACNAASITKALSGPDASVHVKEDIKSVVVDIGTHMSALGFPFCCREDPKVWVKAIKCIQDVYNPKVISLVYPRLSGGSSLFWALKRLRSNFDLKELNMTWPDENGDTLTRNILQ